MKKRAYKKRSITLLEIMIVIFLIGIIGSTIGYNMKGAVAKGRAFKTQEAQKKIKDTLMLEIASGEDIDDVLENPKYYLEKSGLVRDEKNILKDGWGKAFDITKIDEVEIDVFSQNLKNYEDRMKGKRKK
jgi:general secretion pathway protein G